MRIQLNAGIVVSIFLCALLLCCTGSDDEIDEEDNDDDDTADESGSPCAENEPYESMQWLFEECFIILDTQVDPVNADAACHLYLSEDVLCFIDCADASDACDDAGLLACLQNCGLEMMK